MTQPACYVNSLIQCYFMIPEFVEAVLRFDPSSALPPGEDPLKLAKDNPELTRQLELGLFITELQTLFANMILSDKKYADPTKLLQLLAKHGQVGEIGDQKDVGEFNSAFLALLCEAFQPAEAKQADRDGEGQAEAEAEGEEHKEAKGQAGEKEELNTSKVSLSKSLLHSAPEGVTGTFFGELEEIVSYVENSKTCHSSRASQFGQVMLDVAHHELYEAWERSFYTEIDGYKPEGSAEPTRAIQELWVRRPPTTLLFQLQRVKYDLEAKALSKSNAPFHFPKQISLDRYLQTHIEKARHIREKVQELRKKQALLAKALDQYKAEDGRQLPLLLAEVQAFLAKQNSEPAGGAEGPAAETVPYPGLKLFSPFQLGLPNQKLGEVQKLLRGMQQQLKEQMAILESQLGAIKDEIGQAYESIESEHYELFGVLVHDGQTAEYGHYYVYIYDADMRKWRKYNDINVTEVSEEEVFSDGVGGAAGLSSSKSAYCLLYQKRARKVSSLPGVLLRSFSVSSEDPLLHKEEGEQEQARAQAQADYYSDLVPKPLAEKIREENRALAAEFEQFKSKQLGESVLEVFRAKMAKMRSLSAKFKGKLKSTKVQLLSFALFLFLEKQREFFSKWVLLNQAVAQQRPFGLQTLQEVKEPLWDALVAAKASHPSEVPDLVLHESQKNLLKEELAEYSVKKFYSAVNMLVFRAMQAQQWEEVIKIGKDGSRFVNEAKKEHAKLGLKNMPHDALRVLFLSMLAQVSRQLHAAGAHDSAKILELGGYLAFGLHYLPESDNHHRVMLAVMKKHAEAAPEAFGGAPAKAQYAALIALGQGEGEGPGQENDPFAKWSNPSEVSGGGASELDSRGVAGAVPAVAGGGAGGVARRVERGRGGRGRGREQGQGVVPQHVQAVGELPPQTGAGQGVCRGLLGRGKGSGSGRSGRPSLRLINPKFRKQLGRAQRPVHGEPLLEHGELVHERAQVLAALGGVSRLLTYLELAGHVVEVDGLERRRVVLADFLDELLLDLEQERARAFVPLAGLEVALLQHRLLPENVHLRAHEQVPALPLHYGGGGLPPPRAAAASR